MGIYWIVSYLDFTGLTKTLTVDNGEMTFLKCEGRLLRVEVR